jgi:hypothetical protein
VRARFGGFEGAIAVGLSLRHDNGTQYVSDAFQREIAWLGIQSSPSFVRAPEGNGCAERFIRTLKEQLLWVRRFKNVEELRVALREWLEKYNEKWLVGVSSKGHIDLSVKVRPRLIDSKPRSLGGAVAGNQDGRALRQDISKGGVAKLQVVT